MAISFAFINFFSKKEKVKEEADVKKLMLPLAETMGITQNILASLTSGGSNSTSTA
jgi:hypothetical protein